MGQLKQVMDIGGKPMIYQVAEPFLHAGLDLIVIIGHEQKRVRAALQNISCEYILNAKPEQGMFSSVKLGCLAVPPGEPCLLSTCDCPGIKPQTIQHIKETLEKESTKVVIPACQGRRGHPAGLPGFLVDRIRNLPFDTPGLNSLWQEKPDMVLSLPVDDPAVVRDLDRIEDVNALKM